MEAAYTVTPLAPLDEVYIALRAITDSKTGIQDRSKILLQFSMDTVQWKLKEGKIINEVPFRPSYSAIQSRLLSDAISAFSLKLQNPYLIFEDATDGTRNVIWYENASSIQAKINLAKAFKIGGLSVWRLGTIPDESLTSESDDSLDIWRQIKSNYR
jgi:spore germination protein YaaH